MHKNIQITKLLLLISTILLVVLSAYYSILGLSSLFAGKKLLVGIMATGFLISKVTILSILTIYWRKLYATIKMYFIFSAIALVLISSSGIYSYLSQAYFLTIKLANTIQNSTDVVSSKIAMLLLRKNNILKLNLMLLKQIEHLSRLTLNIRLLTQRTRSILKFSNKKLKNLLLTSSIDLKIFALNDSIMSISTSSVNLHSGTFIQIARLFNTSIDAVAQFFLFLIILIFDPLAVLFVIVINLNIFAVSTLSKKDLQSLNLIYVSQPLPIILLQLQEKAVLIIELKQSAQEDLIYPMQQQLTTLMLFKKKDLE